MKKIIIACICIIIILVFIGFKFLDSPLRIGMIPYKDSKNVLETFSGIEEYLSKSMNKGVEVTVCDSYYDLVSKMKQKKIDIAYFGPFSYISASTEIDIEPLIVGVRENMKKTYKSIIITKKEIDGSSIENLKGYKMAFVDKGSTSGYLIPSSLFYAREIEIDEFFKNVYFAKGHDNVIKGVRDGIYDVGASNDIMYDFLIESGELKEDDVNIIWESEKIMGSLFTARKTLDSKTKNSFIEAMLSIHINDYDALKKYNSQYIKYDRCYDYEYNPVRNIAKIMEDNDLINEFLEQ